MAKRGPKEVTEEHKAAMAAGRAEGSVVRKYLEAVQEQKPKRGRRRTPDSIRLRLVEINKSMDSAGALNQLAMAQERIDLEDELRNLESTVDLTPLKDDFVRVAAGYGTRKGISYAAWRQVGVPAPVLSEAGITRSSS